MNKAIIALILSLILLILLFIFIYPLAKKKYSEEYNNVNMCNSCKGPILKDHKFTKQEGLYFHRACWKQLLRDNK